jgi:hypothetical protein
MILRKAFILWIRWGNFPLGTLDLISEIIGALKALI